MKITSTQLKFLRQIHADLTAKRTLKKDLVPVFKEKYPNTNLNYAQLIYRLRSKVPKTNKTTTTTVRIHQ